MFVYQSVTSSYFASLEKKKHIPSECNQTRKLVIPHFLDDLSIQTFMFGDFPASHIQSGLIAGG